MAEPDDTDPRHADDAVAACWRGITVGWPSTCASPRTLGEIGERIAADHLRAHGGRVIDCNWRSGRHDLPGELDLVVFDAASRTLIVGEVKVRSDRRFGGSLAAVSPAQQRRIRRLTAARIAAGTPAFDHARFDLIGIDVDGAVGRGAARLTHVAWAW